MTASKNDTAQQFFNEDRLTSIIEPVGDIPLLIGQMLKMGLPEILDRHIPRHGKQRGLSWGWTATIWLAYIASENDHRKISMSEYAAGMVNTLSAVTGQPIDKLDFDDDRLSHLLHHLSNPNIWHAVECDLSERCIEVYALPKEIVRCDPTTISGYHEVKKEGLMQFGHSKDDPSLPQIKLTAASLDPLGMPFVTEVVSGEKADDVLYKGLIERVKGTLKQSGVLIGDCKASALDIRAQIVKGGDYYLSPLPKTGETAKEMPGWINTGLEKKRDGNLKAILRENAQGEIVLAAHAYEFKRARSAIISGETVDWEERVIISA